MTDTDETKRPKTLSLKKTETSTVKQSFSHGRTKAVVVEKVKTRVVGKPTAAATPRRGAAPPRAGVHRPDPAAAPQAPPRSGGGWRGNGRCAGSGPACYCNPVQPVLQWALVVCSSCDGALSLRGARQGSGVSGPWRRSRRRFRRTVPAHRASPVGSRLVRGPVASCWSRPRALMLLGI